MRPILDRATMHRRLRRAPLGTVAVYLGVGVFALWILLPPLGISWRPGSDGAEFSRQPFPIIRRTHARETCLRLTRQHGPGPGSAALTRIETGYRPSGAASGRDRPRGAELTIAGIAAYGLSRYSVPRLAHIRDDRDRRRVSFRGLPIVGAVFLRGLPPDRSAQTRPYALIISYKCLHACPWRSWF